MIQNKKSNIFILAHPDDEMGILPLIDKHRSYFFYLTSSLNAQEASARKCESIKFLNYLGVDQKNIFFIGLERGFTDGKLDQVLDAAYNAALDKIRVLDIQWARLLCPAWEGGHHDHDSCFLISIKLARVLNMRCFQFGLYNSFQTTYPFFSTNNPIPLAKMFRISTHFSNLVSIAVGFFYFRSQRRTWLALAPFFLLRYLSPFGLKLQTVKFEQISRPHEGPLFYEQRFKRDWQELQPKFKNFFEGSET